MGSLHAMSISDALGEHLYGHGYQKRWAEEWAANQRKAATDSRENGHAALGQAWGHGLRSGWDIGTGDNKGAVKNSYKAGANYAKAYNNSQCHNYGNPVDFIGGLAKGFSGE